MGFFYFSKPQHEDNRRIITRVQKKLTVDTKPELIYDDQQSTTTKEVIIEPKKIIADLKEMKIYTYENGEILKEMNIVSKGRPESYYETPTGSYKIILKERNHFSSIGHVYMPYSMQFFGNFFIHGIPYYQDGEKVSSTYSGGCIRLADEDAKYIYEFSEKGTEVIIKNLSDEVADKNISDVKFVKMMNALVALENVTMNQDNLDTVRQMVKNNDSDYARYLASQIGSSFFLNQMNEKAKSIGINDTEFLDVKDTVKTTDSDKQKFIDFLYNDKFYLYNIAFN
jgi:hypothetical protein